jgi:hypothetical protein
MTTQYTDVETTIQDNFSHLFWASPGMAGMEGMARMDGMAGIFSAHSL